MAVQTLNVGMTTGKDSVTMPAYGFRIGLSGRTGSGALAAVLAILAKGTAAAWWTPQSGLIYQENVGPTAAAANGDSIGLSLDWEQWGGKSLAGELAAQSELRGNGATALVGSATAASYNTSTGAGSVSRGADINNQSYVAWTGLVGNGLYAITVTNGSVATFIRSGTFSGTTQVALTAGLSGTFYVQASVGGQITFTASANSSTSTFTVTSIKYLPGYPASQSSATLKPKLQAGPVARFDGVDDAWGTGLIPSTSAMTLISKVLTSATSAVLVGSVPSSVRCFLATDANGHIAGGIGSESVSTIHGTTDIRGTQGVGALTFGASRNKLYWQGVNEYDAASSGSPATSVGVGIGAAATGAGTFASYAAADLAHVMAIVGYAATDAEIATITNYLNTH